MIAAEALHVKWDVIFPLLPDDAELILKVCEELPDDTEHCSMLVLLPELAWAAGLPRMQGAAIAAAVRLPAGAEMSDTMLFSTARPISKNAAPGTSALPLTLQWAWSPLDQTHKVLDVQMWMCI